MRRRCVRPRGRRCEMSFPTAVRRNTSLRALSTQLEEHRAALLVVDERLHGVEPFERVLAVEDAGRVRPLVLHEHRAAPEAAVDRRAADQHREGEPAPVELLHAERHLLRCRHEQRRQPDRVGPDLDRLVDDRVDRHLLAEVVHRVAVVREDRVDERLPDVVHVAVHRREHDLPLRVALLALEELLEVRHRPLHHLRGLQHERQDQLARAEAVAHFLHRGEQHVVEHAHGVLAHAGRVERELHRRPSCGGGPASGCARPASIAVASAAPLAASAAAFGPRAAKCSMKRCSASGRRLKTRSSASARSSAGISTYGVTWAGFTIAMSSPACHAVVQEHGVQHGARVRVEPEAHVAHAQAREHARAARA